MYCFFFFQAEDGIRDLTVTGVQTCALPISARYRRQRARRTADESAEGQSVLGGAARRDRESEPDAAERLPAGVRRRQIGRASCRERVLISVDAVSLQNNI